MRISDLFRRALKNLLKNKSRNMLTILATAIGTAAIITMVSVTGSMEEKVIGKFTEDVDLLKIAASQKYNKGNAAGDSLKSVEMIRKIKGVNSAAITGDVEYEGNVVNSNIKMKPKIVAVDMETLKNTSSLLATGQPVSNINDALVSGNFLENTSKINDGQWKISISDSSNHNKITEIPICIKGTLKDEKPLLVENIYKNEQGKYPQIIYMPMERVDEVSSRSFAIKRREFDMQVKDLDSMDYVLQQLKDNKFDCQSSYERMKEIRRFFLIVQVIMGVLGGITLVIAAIGTANTMNMSVMERRKEIGIIKAIDLSIGEGEFVAIAGKSGSGKSTLLNLMAGFMKPESGTISVLGTDITKLSENKMAIFRQKNLGFIFQSYNLIPTMTAFENMELPLELAGVAREKREDEVTRIIELMDLEGREEHYPSELSGGEQQRVGIGRAMILGPKMIFADEPTGNLDSNTESQIMGCLREINEKLKTTLIVVTHDKEIAESADRVIHIKDGRIEG